MTLDIQALTMLHMVGAGLYLGAVFDTYSHLRIKKNRWLTFVQDVGFWIVNGVLVFIWLQLINQGVVRIYIFLSIFCGFAMYRALFQQTYLKVLNLTIHVVTSIYRTIVKLINVLLIKPIVFLYKILIWIIFTCAGVLIQCCRYIYRLVVWICRPFYRLILSGWNRLWQAIRKPKQKIDDSNQEIDENNQAIDADQQEERKKKRGFFANLAKRLFRKKRK